MEASLDSPRCLRPGTVIATVAATVATVAAATKLN
jgi:hypothetical protein